MWFLHVFGKSLERRLGWAPFLVFYFACGLLAGMAHILFNPYSATPALGASGAIAGILAAYMVLFPKARVATLFVVFFFIRVLEVPAPLLIGIWFLGQTWAALQQIPGEIAYWAHIGGFLAGLLLLPRATASRPASYGPRLCWPESWAEESADVHVLDQGFEKSRGRTAGECESPLNDGWT